MSGPEGPEHTEDGRWIVVNGRRWRATDPELGEALREPLVRALGRARSAVGRAEDDAVRREARRRVQLAKEGLGERGEPWWDLDVPARRARAEDRLDRITRREAGELGGDDA